MCMTPSDFESVTYRTTTQFFSLPTRMCFVHNQRIPKQFLKDNCVGRGKKG